MKYAKADLNATPPAAQTTMQSIAKPSVNAFEDISKIRNRQNPAIKFEVDKDTSLRDFYWRYDRGIEPYDTSKYTMTFPSNFENLADEDKAKLANKNFYELSFSNKGGLVMPIIIEWTFKDGTKEIDRIPAQVWRLNENKVTKFFMKDKEVASIKLDPMRETADINESNNTWGSTTAEPTKFAVFKQKQAARGQTQGTNPMQKAKEKKGF